MATDIISIWNYALSHCAISNEVQSTTENTANANACRRFYDQTRQEVMGDFPWPFAGKIVTLALVSNNPTPEWTYAYGYPSDCLSFRRILSTIDTATVYTRNPTIDQRVPYRRVGELLYTDWPNAMGEYTQDISDPTLFDTLFVTALAAKLAYYLVPRLTAGDPANLRKVIAQLYAQSLAQAQANAYNEEAPDVEPDADIIQARDY